MRKCTSAALVLWISCVAQAGGQDEWKEFRSKEHSFRVLTPAALQLLGPKDGPGLKNYLVEFDGKVFSVQVAEVPGAQFENEKQTEDRLENAIKSLQAKMKVEKETKITLAGVLRGREAFAETAGNVSIRMRFFMVNGRLYQVVTGGTRDWTASAGAEKFLDSFMLTQ